MTEPACLRLNRHKCRPTQGKVPRNLAKSSTDRGRHRKIESCLVPYLETPEHSHLSQGRHTRSASRRRRSGRRWSGPLVGVPLPKRAVGRRRDSTASSATTATTWPATGPSTACPPTASPRMRKRGSSRSASCAAASCRRPAGRVPTARPSTSWRRGSRTRSMPPPTSRAAGRVSLRRLNRREYAHAIRDLLALEVDATALLPQDNVEGYFDNNADALQVSPAFVSQYIDAARAIALEAVGDAEGVADRDAVRRRGEHGHLAAARRRARARACSSIICRACRSARAAASSSSTTSRRTASTSSRSATWRSRAKCRAWSSRTPLSCCSTARSSIARRSAAKPITRRSTRRSIPPSRRSTAGCARFASTRRPGQHELAVTFVHRSFAESDERTRTAALEGGQERIQAAHALQIRGPLTVTGIGEARAAARSSSASRPRAPTSGAARRRSSRSSPSARFAVPSPTTISAGSWRSTTPACRDGGFEGGVRDALSRGSREPALHLSRGVRRRRGHRRAERPRARVAPVVLLVEQPARPRAARARGSERASATPTSWPQQVKPHAGRRAREVARRGLRVPVARRREARRDRPRPRPVPAGERLARSARAHEGGARACSSTACCAAIAASSSC